MTDISDTRAKEETGRALQRLLDIKGPVRQKHKAEQPFLQALDDVIAVMNSVEEDAGWLNGSISGRCWQDFMQTLRADLIDRLTHYRERPNKSDFSPASLSYFKEERRRIERLYVRDLVALYHQAAQTYKTLSG